MLNKQINIKTNCEGCGCNLIKDECEIYLIDPNENKFIHLCKDCSNKRIESIRKIFDAHTKHIVESQKDLDSDIAEIINDNFWDLI